MEKKENNSVQFKVTEIIDKRNWGSSLELGKTYTGVFDQERKDIIYWVDPKNEQEWVFYVGVTCQIIEEL